MPLLFSLTLAVVVLLIIATRFVVAHSSFPRAGRPVRAIDVVLIAAGMLGLFFHCFAMFDRRAASAIPWSHPAVAEVNAMGPASVALFVIPAALLLVGVRNQRPMIVTVEALTLAAVGVTMYDHGPLQVHLAAIFVAVTVLAAVLALVVSRPSRSANQRPSGV